MRPVRFWMHWGLSAAAAALITLGLFAGLSRLPESGDTATASPTPRAVRLVRFEPPPSPPLQQKTVDLNERPRRELQPPAAKAPQAEHPPAPAAAAIGFSPLPRMAGIRPLLDGLALQAIDLPRPEGPVFCDETELDTPLSPLAQPPPVYPLRARQNGTEGWVRVRFVVLPDGRVSDVEILEAEPRTTFDACVRQCVARWRFAPGTIQGEPVRVRAVTTLRFDLEG